MKKLLTFVYNQLNDLGYGVYDKMPPPKTQYPFIYYSVDEPYRNINPTLYTLTIDVWDRNQGTYRVEDVADKIDNKLEKKSYSDECISATVTRQSRNKIEDTDAEIKRRRLTYQLRVFDICKGEIK